MSKISCSAFWLYEIDSFDLFKNKIGLQYVRQSKAPIILEIPSQSLQVVLSEDDNFKVISDCGSYIIPIERKKCNFGGFYHFFHCPACKKRMRKLYCLQGMYLCRKCANLGYYSQRLSSVERNKYMRRKVEVTLKSRAGSLSQKPPWMKRHTFQKFRRKFIKYDEKSFIELANENFKYFGRKGMYIPPAGMYDAYHWNE